MGQGREGHGGVGQEGAGQDGVVWGWEGVTGWGRVGLGAAGRRGSGLDVLHGAVQNLHPVQLQEGRAGQGPSGVGQERVGWGGEGVWVRWGIAGFGGAGWGGVGSAGLDDVDQDLTCFMAPCRISIPCSSRRRSRCLQTARESRTCVCGARIPGVTQR